MMIMKLPNGFGSVYKLSGKRRNPWVARKTTGWTFNKEKKKIKYSYSLSITSFLFWASLISSSVNPEILNIM